MHYLNGSKETDETSFYLELNKGILLVKCPLITQQFRINLSGANPVSYFGESRFSFFNPPNSEVIRRWKEGLEFEWDCACHFQYWIASRGPNSMFVKDEYERFENKAVLSGGRPESNRQKF